MFKRSFLVLTLTLVAAGCSRIGGREMMEESETLPRTQRASSSAQLPAQASAAGRSGSVQAPAATRGSSAGTGGSPEPARQGVRDTQPELALATAPQCVVAPLAPASDCLDVDPAEPNDKSKPIALPIAPLCGYVEANISAGDVDAYTFKTEKSDPVLIEVSYTGAGKADLEQAIYGSTDNLITSQRNTRGGAGEDMRSIIHSVAGGTYSVRVSDTNDSEACQRYALRVDPLYCADDYEDNDMLSAATKLRLDSSERANIQGKVLEDDDDYFEITTERADPVLVTGSYTAPTNSTAQVTRAFYDGAGALKTSVAGARKTETESFTHWLSAPSKGSVLRTRLSATGNGCASYELQLDAAACTDVFEDNDSAAEAAKLASNTDVVATIFTDDDDYYAFAAMRNGACTVTYDIPSGRSQQLVLGVYDGAGALVTDRTGGQLNGTVNTLRVSWTDREAVQVKVSANNGGYCQPYKLRCEPAAGQ